MANLQGDASRVVRDAYGGCTPVRRLSTLPGLKLPVSFILMRDKRESTQPNAPRQAAFADRLPKVLASRLRTARRAIGLSQGAVAAAMNDRGFSWRQTTVAKTEAADRPVLFAEVAALAQIYKREIEYFLYAGTELDGLVDEATRELDGIRHALSETAKMLAALKNDRNLYECTIGVATSIQRYRNTGDSGSLLGDIRMLVSRWGYMCLTLEDVFEAIGVTQEQLAAVDERGLEQSARWERDRYGAYAHLKADGSVPETLTSVVDFLEGKEASEALINVLREGGAWADTVTSLLTDLVISAVDSQFGPEKD
jgi:transcriptional regulator with XRE-family HTH domain